MMKLVFVLFGVFVLGAGCAPDPQEREEFVADAHAQLERLEEGIDDLEAEAREAKGELRTRMQDTVKELKAKARVTRERLDEFATDAGEARRELRKGASAALEELKRSYERARKEFR